MLLSLIHHHRHPLPRHLPWSCALYSAGSNSSLTAIRKYNKKEKKKADGINGPHWRKITFTMAKCDLNLIWNKVSIEKITMWNVCMFHCVDVDRWQLHRYGGKFAVKCCARKWKEKFRSNSLSISSIPIWAPIFYGRKELIMSVKR